MPQPSWRGQLTDGRTALVHDIVLTVENDALVGTFADPAASGADDRVALRWPLGRIQVVAEESGRVRLTSPDAPDAALTTDAADAAAQAALTHDRAVKTTASRWRVILTYAAGAAALVALLYANLDPLARAVARRVPASYEAELGRGLAAVLARDYCETAAAQGALQRLVQRLGRPGDAAPQTPHIMNTPMVNAFTLPGGVVVVTRGLIEQTTSPDELAGVVAHELEHVRRRHVMTHVVRGALLTALWQATVGDYSGLLIVDPRTAVDIANLRFSRRDEREADEGALERLDAASISRAGLRTFFDRMRAATDSVPVWLSNHPSSAERVAAIHDEVGAVHRTPALVAADWAALKTGCSAARR